MSQTNLQIIGYKVYSNMYTKASWAFCISTPSGLIVVEEVSMKWMDRPSVTEMHRGGVCEMD